MKEFGWSIEYVLSLSYPVFHYLGFLVSRLRADAAVNEMYRPYIAAKLGGKFSKGFFEQAGTLTIRDGAPIPTAEASQETIERATQKLRAIIESRKARAARK